MRRYIVTLRIIKLGDIVGMMPLNHGLMKELSVALPLFEPLDLRFLAPKDLFLLIMFIKLGRYVFLLMG
jgi:hypothetical protein